MNVRELREALSKYDDDTMVVVDGYEGGVHEVGNVEAVRVVLNVNTAWYYGEHEVEDPAYVNEHWKDKPRADAVTIG